MSLTTYATRPAETDEQVGTRRPIRSTEMEARLSIETMNRPPVTFRHQTGDVLGSKYRLERRIGAGGMGEVWLATNVALDLPVAIKLVHDDLRGPRSEHM